MKLTLVSNDSYIINKARRLLRRGPNRISISIRKGNLYTMTYNPGRQPRTESQQKNWSLFKQANALVAADFANPKRRSLWNSRLKSQSRYKTARGLARAYYIAQLRRHMSQKHYDKPSAHANAARHLSVFNHSTYITRPTNNPTHNSHSILNSHLTSTPNSTSFASYSHLYWWHSQLHSIPPIPLKQP
ncbi:MAG: hypothetical protein MJZ15_05315 [Bacteroidales bacterium]|nr:hypothetical protein [Bacteroidales bacterium]